MTTHARERFHAVIDFKPVDRLPVAQQIALDRVLMREVGTGSLPPLMRIWQCVDEAVVIGVSQKPDVVANLFACREDNVAVFRRFSGGGAVFIGKGCVVYSVIFRAGYPVKLHDVEGAYRHVLTPVIEAFDREAVPVEFHPPCDLAINGMKIAGNAQAQRRGAVLVHGSMLVSADIGRMARYLPEPTEAPAYRAGRPHGSFVCNLSDRGYDCARVAALLHDTWAPDGAMLEVPGQLIGEAGEDAESD